jgi:DNA-binding GntR family transcriptional regulator
MLTTPRGANTLVRVTPRSTRREARAEVRVFDAILDAILDHRLAPGTKLKERELSEIFGASRSAVRAALTRLGHSLLVELRPNRGAVIANPSVAETRQLFEARRVIESAVVRTLAGALTPAKRARLRAFVTEEQAAYARGDLKTGQALSIRFHKLLSELAGNAVLDRFMESLICLTPLLVLAHQGTRLAYCGVDEHRAVAEALARGDAAAAEKRMVEHLTHLEGQLRLDEPALSKSLAAALGAGGGKSRVRAGASGALAASLRGGTR